MLCLSDACADTKVSQLYCPAPVEDQDVVRLHISVRDAALVEVLQSLDQLQNKPQLMLKAGPLHIP